MNNQDQTLYLHDIHGRPQGINFLHVAHFYTIHEYQPLKTTITFANTVVCHIKDQVSVRETVEEIRAMLAALKHGTAPRGNPAPRPMPRKPGGIVDVPNHD